MDQSPDPRIDPKDLVSGESNRIGDEVDHLLNESPDMLGEEVQAENRESTLLDVSMVGTPYYLAPELWSG